MPDQFSWPGSKQGNTLHNKANVAVRHNNMISNDLRFHSVHLRNAKRVTFRLLLTYVETCFHKALLYSY